FFFNSVGLSRPEVVHYRKSLKERYTKPKQAKTLLLIPQTRTKPFHKSQEYKQIAKLISNEDKVHVCFYAAPFGVVPIELDEVYPLSQHETALPLDKGTAEYVANQVADYISRANYTRIVLIDDSENWNRTVLDACKETCRQKRIKFRHINIQKINLARLRLALEF
ncbi:MAG TPA: DUF5591 domain-containing protein, partial [Acidobacteriota bacterium]|nr:DUF5591 domain-containing protein [Acidobacteriota bacterium]